MEVRSSGRRNDAAHGRLRHLARTRGSAGLARLADGSVNVPMLAQRRMNLRTQVSVESDVARTVELPGRVVMDPNAGGRVQTAVGGKVEPGPNGLPVAGQTVRKGEVLAFVARHVDPVTIGGQQSPVKGRRSLVVSPLS